MSYATIYPQAAIPYGEYPSDRVMCVACSPDGRYLALGGTARNVQIYDLVDEAIVALFEWYKASVTTVAWSPDGRYLATTSEDAMRLLWEVHSKRLLCTLPERSGSVQDSAQSMAWSPDGCFLASANGQVEIWDLGNRQQLCVCAPSSQMFSVAWSPDGRYLAAGGMETLVRVWDNRGILVGELAGYRDLVTAVVWSPDGKQIATSSLDHPLRVWSVARLDTSPVLSCVQKNLQIQTVVWSPDGRCIALGAVDGTVRIWDARTALLRAVLVSGEDAIFSVCWAPHGRFIAGGVVSEIKLWPM